MTYSAILYFLKWSVWGELIGLGGPVGSGCNPYVVEEKYSRFVPDTIDV